MSASDMLTNFISKLLESGIVIDDGRERIVISSAGSMEQHSGTKASRHITLEAPFARSPLTKKARPDRAKKARPRRKSRASNITPQRLYSIVELHAEGVAKASLAKLLKTSKPKLARLMIPLKEKGRVTEDALRYYPIMTEAVDLSASSRKRRKSCIVPSCNKPHYAKGFCNNCYNISRRETAKVDVSQRRVRKSVPTTETRSYKSEILDTLRRNVGNHSLYELASLLDKKWQTLRKDVQELINENKVVKDGKKYTISSSQL